MTAETDMGVAAVPRWAWVVAGLVVGLLHGSLREWASTVDPTDDYDVLLTDQGRFESALVDERLGHRLFKDVTVYPHWLPSRSTGGKRLVHLVTGSYWDGNTSIPILTLSWTSCQPSFGNGASCQWHRAQADLPCEWRGA